MLRNQLFSTFAVRFGNGKLLGAKTKQTSFTKPRIGKIQINTPTWQTQTTG